MPTTISPTTKSYIAGFLDGDGCIMFQLIRRKDYVYGYQIRASIVFYQKTTYRYHLEYLKDIFQVGYIRDRTDGVTEYTIVGLEPVIKILKLLQPYICLKKGHVEVALKINSLLRTKTKKRIDSSKFIRAAQLVDQFGVLNDSKTRTITSRDLKMFLRQHNLYPRND
ncbi:LAGLIDADG family homing endonuclease [Patescibacteria group bacterium AH-259-L07]|nr:LAGLIDADG family homing endonuclease [Patescibacteria group bacterium AH-259-L07]